MASAPLLGSQDVSMDSDNILIWNVCDINSRARRTVVVDTVVQECVPLVCIQETKLSVMDSALVISICGRGDLTTPLSRLMAPEVASWFLGVLRHGQCH
jgi:hypothetical protein